ncbi:MAG: Lrp/AsnC ligand binding domain-containing protein, partial [Gemmobacter sp.]
MLGGAHEHEEARLEAEWQRRFLEAVRARPEVLEAHRLAGDIDYILK